MSQRDEQRAEAAAEVAAMTECPRCHQANRDENDERKDEAAFPYCSDDCKQSDRAAVEQSLLKEQQDHAEKMKSQGLCLECEKPKEPEMGEHQFCWSCSGADFCLKCRRGYDADEAQGKVCDSCKEKNQS